MERAERELGSRLGREPSEGDVERFIAATPLQAREVRTYRASRSVLSFEVLAAGDARVPAAGIDELLDRLAVEKILEILSPAAKAYRFGDRSRWNHRRRARRAPRIFAPARDAAAPRRIGATEALH